jgi:hypothetical protein
MKPTTSTAIVGMGTIAAAALILLVAACAPTHVESSYSSPSGPLPRPQMIVVQDFIAPGGGGALDRGLRARLQRELNGSSAAAESETDAAKAVDALARSLVEQLVAAGLPAMRSAAPPASDRDPVLIVAGQLLSVDEGNATRRNLVGLGAGHSEVVADVQVYLARRGQSPALVQSFKADAQSSRKPGAAETAGVGAATGRMAESAAGNVAASELVSASTEADAARMGKEIANKIAALIAAAR